MKTQRSESIEAETMRRLLIKVQKSFYQHRPKELFHRDKRFLQYTLSWGAHWLYARRLRISNHHYEQLISERLRGIKIHGNADKYEAYFPRYLLKCIQDWFKFQGDGLYCQIKHVSHWINLPNIPQSINQQHQELNLELLSRLNLILRPKPNQQANNGNKQLELF